MLSRVLQAISAQTYLQLPLRQWVPALFISVVQMKGKHCRQPNWRNEVVVTLGPYHIFVLCISMKKQMEVMLEIGLKSNYGRQ
jgi:hypothetical protein